jgi:hypothetical protein
MAITNVNLTATGTSTVLGPKLGTDNSMMVEVSGTYAGVVFTFEASIDGVAPYAQIAAVDMAAMTIITGGSSVTPGTNASKLYRIPAENLAFVRINCSAYSSGTAVFGWTSANYQGGVLSNMLIQNVTNSGNVTTTGTTTITSASAAALAVGRQGATNPALNVDASAATSVTGFNIAAAASGGGLALSVISSAGAENLKVDALGTGTVTIGSVSTGNVILGTSGHTITLNNGTGAVTLAAGGLTLTTGSITVSSGGVTSTGANCSFNASSNFNFAACTGTSTGTVGLGNTLAGAVTIQSGAASTYQVTGGNLTLGTLTSGTLLLTSAGAITAASSGTSSWANTSGGLTISTATSGTLALTSAGALNCTSVAASTWTHSGGTWALTSTSAGITISTAPSGTLALTSAGALNCTSVAASTWTHSGGTWTLTSASTGISIITTTSGTITVTSAGAIAVTSASASTWAATGGLTFSAGAVNFATAAPSFSATQNLVVASNLITIAQNHTTSATSTVACAAVAPAGQPLQIVFTETAGTGTVVNTFTTHFKTSGTLTVPSSGECAISFVGDGTNWVEVGRGTTLS